jgi:hypothetical protein
VDSLAQGSILLLRPPRQHGCQAALRHIEIRLPRSPRPLFVRVENVDGLIELGLGNI